jgi:hypothetical protein
MNFSRITENNKHHPIFSFQNIKTMVFCISQQTRNHLSLIPHKQEYSWQPQMHPEKVNSMTQPFSGGQKIYLVSH